MPNFVIVRGDGTNDLVDGASVEDVARRYGWPGNGDIVAWAGQPITRQLKTPEDQNTPPAQAPATDQNSEQSLVQRIENDLHLPGSNN